MERRRLTACLGAWCLCCCTLACVLGAACVWQSGVAPLQHAALAGTCCLRAADLRPLEAYAGVMPPPNHVRGTPFTGCAPYDSLLCAVVQGSFREGVLTCAALAQAPEPLRCPGA